MAEQQALFEQDLVFEEDFASVEEAFTVMAGKFYSIGLVKETYLAALKEREKGYPTGIDLSVIGDRLPNVAIPHTERTHCNLTKVVLVKLKQAIAVNNMMNPTQALQVRYLFMILNGADIEQTDILGKIMELVTHIETIEALEKATSTEELYEVVKNQTI